MTPPDRIALPVAVRRDDVLHFLGYPRGRTPAAAIDRRLDGILDQARELSEARGAFRLLEAAAAPGIGLEAVAAEQLAVGLVTLGDRLERRATALLDSGDTVGGLLLDAAGSAAVEEAADRLGALIAGAEADPERAAAALGCRISPGYGRWPLEAQTALFARLPHRALGVDLLPSLLMTPRKSISFAMWLGTDARPVAGLSGCDRCLLATCRYRQAGRTGGTDP